MRRFGTATAIVALGLAATAIAARLTVGSWRGALVGIILLQTGPAWALAFCAASTDDDFVGSSQSRAEWMRTLPWAFVLAPLLVPNFVLLASFFRDSRADSGRTSLGFGRDRPADPTYLDHHWPG